MERKERKWLIEVTDEQLRLIADCIDDCSQFAGGDCQMWSTTPHLDREVEIKYALRQCEQYIRPNGVGSNCKWNGAGAKNGRQCDFIKKTYALYREMRHQLVLADGINNTYTSETLTCEGNGGLPKVEVKPLKTAGWHKWTEEKPKDGDNVMVIVMSETGDAMIAHRGRIEVVDTFEISEDNRLNRLYWIELPTLREENEKCR